jgi:hypothetical protein
MKTPITGFKIPIFVIDYEKNQWCRQRFADKFLLKRKLAIGVYIKIVVQITIFLMSGQQRDKTIPTRRYTNSKKP